MAETADPGASPASAIKVAPGIFRPFSSFFFVITEIVNCCLATQY